MQFINYKHTLITICSPTRRANARSLPEQGGPAQPSACGTLDRRAAPIMVGAPSGCAHRARVAAGEGHTCLVRG